MSWTLSPTRRGPRRWSAPVAVGGADVVEAGSSVTGDHPTGACGRAVASAAPRLAQRGHDPGDWFQTHEHLVREGYAWVGVSAQRAGVHSATGLRAWSPERYGS
ncbi:alpha/beta hydrolase domain-containing protein, partial [Cellulosimicrobium cellulans]|uniref:alpha/beta hydrolase domain-containing protein n=1 Tax=Cellulosimicrobium cellulans TaxID=1710 RepID=UPI003450A1EE